MRKQRLPDLVDRPEWAVNLLLARRTLGLTQRQLADRAGLYQDQLSKYETGTKNAGRKMRARIEAVLAELQAETEA